MKTTKKMLLAIAGLLAGVTVLTFGAAPARADSPGSPGRNAVFVSATDVNIPTCCTAPAPVVASGIIMKGKRGHVVSIDGMVMRHGWAASTSNLSIHAKVNGYWVEPTLYPDSGVPNVMVSCPQMFCTVSGMFFFDLDEAEARFPGNFIGKPLEITLHADAYGQPFTSPGVVLRARLEKK